jgi:hypothetical protein
MSRTAFKCVGGQEIKCIGKVMRRSVVKRFGEQKIKYSGRQLVELLSNALGNKKLNIVEGN